MIHKSWILITCLLGFSFLNAQTADLARIEYTYFPQKNSDNSFRRFRAQVAYPIALKKDGAYLVPSVEYRNVNFKFEDPTGFQTTDLDRFQSFTGSLGYTFKFGNDWRFGAEGGLKIASNFSENSILQDDLIYTGSVFFVKIRDKEEVEIPWRLILGLRYSTTTGFPFPLPIVSYYRKWAENWSYTVGIPKTNMKYHFSENSELQAFVTLDGFFANIQRNIDTQPLIFNDRPKAESISMTILLSGLGYQYSITDHLKLYIYGGHTLLNDIRLRDADREDLYTINETNTFYARSGIKFTIF